MSKRVPMRTAGNSPRSNSRRTVRVLTLPSWRAASSRFQSSIEQVSRGFAGAAGPVGRAQVLVAVADFSVLELAKPFTTRSTSDRVHAAFLLRRPWR